MEKILITGGTGLVGVSLIEKLKDSGFEIAVLSRTPKKKHEYKWDINKDFIDEQALLNVDYIIHLAGAGIADKRWTESRKKILIDSRVKSADLIFKKVKEHNVNLKGFISASGVGYYGAVTSEIVFSEKDTPENDFISKICIEWEASAQKFESLNVPVTILRTGVVLSKEGGALQKMNTPLFLSILGNGKQYMPWIHIEDLTNLYIEAIKNVSFKGVFNAVSAAKETNESFTRSLGKTLHKIVLPIGVPNFILKLILGELASILLEGSQVSSQKVESYYQFKYNNLKDALSEIYFNRSAMGKGLIS